MVAKEIIYTSAARAEIGRGLDALADVVRVTLGPRGRNVVLERSWGVPLITKDGVSVAKEIELDNPFENMGAQMVKEVAEKTSDVAGDGTTTAIVLAQAIYREGARLVAAGIDPMEIKRGIEAAVSVVVGALAAGSKPIDGHAEIAQVAKNSANGDGEIGELISEAMEKVGLDGVVTVEEGKSMETALEFTQGMQIDRGYLSPYFVTDTARMEAVLADCLVLLVEQEISNLQDILPLLEAVSGGNHSLLIVAPDVGGEALAALVVNRIQGALEVCAVKAPSFGDARREILQDLAIVCGGNVVSRDLGIELRNVALGDLGRARIISIDKETATFVGGAGAPELVTARANQLRTEIEECSSEFEREKLRERLAKIVGGVAVLKIGGATETEIKERKARVEDALHATRAAIAEGIVPGGGVALLRTLPALNGLVLGGEQRFGVNVIRRAIEQPLRQIARNAGKEGAVVVKKVREGTNGFGYNAASETYEDLVSAGIIDPTMVVRVALQNAASVAALLLTTEVVIAEKPHPSQMERSAVTHRNSAQRGDEQ